METTVKEANRQTQSGIVKTIISRKGYGFIAGDNGEDYFFHASGVVGARFEELREGLQVEYLIADGKRGPKAIGITLK